MMNHLAISGDDLNRVRVTVAPKVGRNHEATIDVSATAQRVGLRHRQNYVGIAELELAGLRGRLGEVAGVPFRSAAAIPVQNQVALFVGKAKVVLKRPMAADGFPRRHLLGFDHTLNVFAPRHRRLVGIKHEGANVTFAVTPLALFLKDARYLAGIGHLPKRTSGKNGKRQRKFHRHPLYLSV